ncbi:MAG: cobyrinate a,c-diamide synthase [Syntrophobacteraceae bacterium]
MEIKRSRLMVAAMRGGAGKTVVSVGLCAAWNRRLGLGIVAFKKGPDYIDAGWLSAASGRPCRNLDPFLMGPEQIVRSFVMRSAKADGALIEANRGLYDGVDANGSYSSAGLAKLLRCPVVLVVDATKVTHTAAAMVLGCRMMDPEVNIGAVILNQVAGKRHETVLRESIEKRCGVPVLGVVPRQLRNFFPERHLGLVPPEESEDISGALDLAAAKMSEYLDIEALWKLASAAPGIGCPRPASPETGLSSSVVKIGVIRDSAFQFYYPENLEALEEKGASLVFISSLENSPLPEIDALYIGGGFPETHLERLSANEVFRGSVKSAVEAGLPVYAECGGLMFLCRGIRHREKLHPMVGVFPFEIILGTKPQGHGYTLMECVGPNPFFPKGTIIRGHEFHYSRIADRLDPGSYPFVFRLDKGHGIVAGWDGMCYKNVLAGYSHLHAVGNERWADAMIAAAGSYQRLKTNISADYGLDRVRPGSQSFTTVY